MKKELIKRYYQGEFTKLASGNITNNSAIVICHIEHGIEDKVFGYTTTGEDKKFFYVKFVSLNTKIVFTVGAMRFDLMDMMVNA